MKQKYGFLLVISLVAGFGAAGFVFAQFEYYDTYSNSNIDYFPANPINTSPRRTGGSSGTNSGSAGKNSISSPTKTESPITTSTPCANRPQQNPQNTRSVEVRDLNGKVFYLSPPKEELTELRAYPETSQKIFKMIMDESGLQKDETEIGLITVDNNCYPKYGYIQDSPAPNPAPQPSPPSAPAAKSKYKTYTNTAFGYSVQYPSHWRPSDPVGDGSSITFDYGKDLISNPDMSTTTSINVIPTDAPFDPNDLEKTTKTMVETIEANRFGDQDLKIKVKNGKIGKIKAKQITYINSFVYTQKIPMVKYLFIKDGRVWMIQGPTKEVKKIFKSFKFILNNTL